MWCLGVREPNQSAPGVKRAWPWCLRGDRGPGCGNSGDLDGVALVLVSESLPLVPLIPPQDRACYPVLMELMDLLALRLCLSLHSP